MTEETHYYGDGHDHADVEGRDWIGNPDGTLVYWQAEAEDARRRADAAERKLHRWADDHADVEGGAGPGYGPSGPEGVNEPPAAARPTLTLPLDLNDPVVENEVADAIRRLAPEGEYVGLEQRYPWRFRDEADQATPTAVADRVVAMLQVAGLVFLVPPGRCGAPHPGEWDDRTQKLITLPVTCENRATHVGQHEGTYWPPVHGLDHGIPVAWDNIVEAEILDDEVLVEGSYFPRADLPEILARHMRSLTESGHEVKRLTIRLERVSALVSEFEASEDQVERWFADRLRAVFLDPDPDVAP